MLAVDRKGLELDVLIEVEPGFDFLSAEYRALHTLKRATAFQSPAWQAAIHRDLVPHLGARQHTIAIRNRSDRTLIAVLPLVVQKMAGLSVAQPADFGVCDANAVVGEPDALDMLAGSAHVRARIAQLLRGTHLVMFRKVRREGFDVRRLFNRSSASPCENAAYHSETGPDFEVWQRKTLSRKFSKELGRLGRQVEREFGPYEHRLARNEAEVRDAFDFLKQARKGRFEEDILDHKVYETFYRNFAISGVGNGDALTYVSYLDGKPVAVLFGVGCEDQCHAVLIGADTDRLAKYSVGMQLLYRAIKLRFDSGLQRLDFGLGNSGYKSFFRVEETLLDNVTVSRSPAGAMLALIYHRSKPLKNALRKLNPRLR